MLISKAARRYASALLQLGKERDEVESILDDIHFIKNTLDDSDDLVVFLRSPVVKFDDKAEALDTLFGEEVQESTSRFMALLTRKKRIHLLRQIVEAFINKYNEYAGIIEVNIYSAFELDDAQKQNLLESLEKRTGKKVKMDIEIDKSLQGGIAIRIDDTVIDGTVKHKLEELEEMFLETSVE